MVLLLLRTNHLLGIIHLRRRVRGQRILRIVRLLLRLLRLLLLRLLRRRHAEVAWMERRWLLKAGVACWVRVVAEIRRLLCAKRVRRIRAVRCSSLAVEVDVAVAVVAAVVDAGGGLLARDARRLGHQIASIGAKVRPGRVGGLSGAGGAASASATETEAEAASSERRCAEMLDQIRRVQFSDVCWAGVPVRWQLVASPCLVKYTLLAVVLSLFSSSPCIDVQNGAEPRCRWIPMLCARWESDLSVKRHSRRRVPRRHPGEATLAVTRVQVITCLVSSVCLGLGFYLYLSSYPLSYLSPSGLQDTPRPRRGTRSLPQLRSSPQPHHMDGQEQETWTADDVDVPPGLSEMSSAISQAPPGSSAPPAASSASPARRRPRSGVDSEAAAEQSLTLERLLGSPSSLRRATSVGGESSVPDHLRRTSAWRLSGPGRVVSDPLGMSLPNDRIELRGRDRARGRQAERVERAERTERTERAERAERTERTERQLPFPWAAHRPGFYYDYSTEVLRSIDSTDRIEEPRSSAQNAARDEARQQLESASTRDEQTMSRLRERSATILNLAAQRRNTSSSIAIPGGRGMISTGPQQVVPTNSHFSWASFGAGTSNVDRRATPAAIALSAASQRPPPTATTPAADAQPEPPASPDAATTSRSERSALTVLRRRRTDTDTAVRSLVERMNEAGRESASSSRQAYAFDPTDISPPGGGDDHIWDFLGMPDSDDDNVSRWGTYRTTDVLRAGRGALPASTPLAHLLDLDAWGSPPDAGAALSRGRFNRRRRSSVRSRETHDEQPVVSMGDDAIMVEVPTPTRRYPPTNTAPSQTPVVVGDERARRRRDSGAESSNDNPWPSKRVRRDPSWPDTTPPTYSSLSSLPGSTPLPTDFAPPTRDSWLGLSCHEIRGVSRPVVTFELTRAASMIIDDTESDACALRANVPIPADIGVHYYEVEVLECGEGYLTVGWMQSQVSLNRLVGWDPGSWGWHGVDGQTFEGSVGRGEGNDFGDAWGSELLKFPC